MKMKKLFFAAMTAVSMLFASCSNEMDESLNVPAGNEEGARVKISLSGGEASVLRSFFDNTAQAELWEKTINSLTICVYNVTRNVFTRRVLTPEELNLMHVIFSIPASQPGDICEFYAIANVKTEVNSRSALLELLEEENQYNGVFHNVTIGAMRGEGFAMSGKTTKTLHDNGDLTTVSITLRRTVAKVAVETFVTPEFREKYPNSELYVNSITLIHGVSSSFVIEQTPVADMRYFIYQQPSVREEDKFNNLFYLFENGEIDKHARAKLEINATFDLDRYNNSSTDLHPMIYTVNLGDDDGKILRNSYYRVQVNIVGLSGNEMYVEINVADWEGPYNKTENVGI